MTVAKIIKAYLIAHDFDGLYCEGECACEIKDLIPCESNCSSCETGYKRKCDCGDHDFHIGPDKE